MNIELNFNRRHDPLLNFSIEPEFLSRIANLALPLISLNADAEKILAVGSGGLSAISKLSQGNIDFELIFTVATVGLRFIHPLAALVLPQLYSLYNAENPWDFVSTSIYITSAVTASKEFQALSLLFQAAKELLSAQEEYQAGRYPEALINLILATLRSHSLTTLMAEIHYDHTCKEVTEEVIEEFVRKIPSVPKAQFDPKSTEFFSEYEKRIRLREFLEDNNYSCRIKNLKFVDGKLSGVNFEGVTFSQQM